MASSESDGALEEPPVKKVPEQLFCSKLLDDPDFKPWLKCVFRVGKKVPHCGVCDVDVTCSKTGLRRHMQSKKHSKASVSATSSAPLQSFFKKQYGSKATTIEVKLCAFIAEQNLPIQIIEPLTELISNLFSKSDGVSDVALKKQKATNMIRQVFGFQHTQEAIFALSSRKFSLIVDESTDRSAATQFAVIACYFDMQLFSTQILLLDLLQPSDTSAEGLFTQIKSCIELMKLPMENIVGFCSDTCNVMFGQHNSVVQLLKHEISHLQTVKCSCHMIHLAASYAALKLPKSLEDLCRDVYANFHRSFKRIEDFKAFQHFFETKPHKMLARGQRRWLSLKACVDRLLEQYEPLQHYFRLVTAEDPTHSTDRIVTTLNNPFMKAYLEFLSFQLERLNGFNRLFQGDYPLLHCLRAEIRGLLQAIAGDFLEPQYVRETAVEELDLGQGNRVPLEEVYIGMAATETLAEIRKGAEQSEVNVFLESCLAFLLEAFKQIKTRFDLTSPVYELVEWTLPANALQRKPTNLSQVLARMPYMKEKVNHVLLDTEWRSHIFTKDLRPEMPWEEYWKKVRDEKVLGSSKYPNLLQLVEVVASLPASNAAVERLFSQLKLIKREQRTALKPQSLVALMQTKMTLANKKETAASFEVSRELLKLAEQAKANATDEESRELKRSFCAKLAKDLNKL